MSRSTIARNVVANIARGSVSALVVLLLPPFLTRILSKDAYGTWLLILQLGTYVTLLDFGIQTAVGRFVAHANELEDNVLKNGIISTSLAILTGSGLFAVLGVSGLAWQLPNLFKSMPLELQNEAQLSLLFVGVSLSIGFPFSVFGGIFIGLQRYDIPAWIVGTSKLMGFASVVLVANYSHSILLMGIVTAICNLSSYFLYYIAYTKLTENIKISYASVKKNYAKQITKYSFNLMLWSFGMLLVSGLDTIIIGLFDYSSLGYFAATSNFIFIISGIQSALFSSLMPTAASMGARKDSDQLGKLLVESTKYATTTLILSTIPLIVFAKEILTVWVGVDYGNNASFILQVLILGNAIRLIGGPYAQIVVGLGQHQEIMVSPVLEAISNFTISMLTVQSLGAIGVAYGTLVGSFFSIIGHIAYSMNQVNSISIDRKLFVARGIMVPIICNLPLALIVLLSKVDISDYSFNRFILSILLLVLCVFLNMKYNISKEDGDKIKSKLSRRLARFNKN